MYSQVIVLFAAFCSSITILALVLGIRKNPGSKSLILFGSSLFVLAVTYSLSLIRAPSSDNLYLMIFHLCVLLACTALFCFSVEYSQPRVWLSSVYIPVLSLFPALILILLWFLASQGVSGFDPPVGDIEPILELFTNIFSVTVLLLATLILAQMSLSTSLSYRFQYGLPIIGNLFPIIGASLDIFGIKEVFGVRLALTALSITGMFLSYALIKYNLLRILPISRTDIVEVLKDGWLFIDR